MKKFFLDRVLPFVLWVLVQLWCRSLRLHNKNPERDPVLNNLSGKYILVLWHSRIFYLFFYLRNRPDLHILISPSRDGDLLANLGKWMGYTIVRGSTFKKAVPAARSLMKILRRDQQIAIVADGSRGPRHKAQPGSLQIAARTGSPIIPVSFDAEPKIELNSWDRFVIPLPFARCTLDFGPPIFVQQEENEFSLQKRQLELEETLNCMTSDGV